MKARVLFTATTPAYDIKLVRYAPFTRMPAHAHDECGLSIVVAGELVEEAEHRSITASAGWAVVKPRGVVHANRFGPSGATLLALTPREPFAAATKARWTWRPSASAFRQALRYVDNPDSDPIGDLVAAIDPTTRIGASHKPWLERVRRTLDGVDAPGVSALADDAGVHRVYLARAFRAAFGVSIREYVKIAQVRRATYLVASTTLSLAQVALECGFADHSHMCRAFRSVAGLNPNRLRT